MKRLRMVGAVVRHQRRTHFYTQHAKCEKAIGKAKERNTYKDRRVRAALKTQAAFFLEALIRGMVSIDWAFDPHRRGS